MKSNIRDEIVEGRRQKIAQLGHGFGHQIPERRLVPINPFNKSPLVICEIKKRSPSRGALNANLDVVAQAGIYKEQGCQSISVLTEEDYFGGSLADLMAIKAAHPDLAILRKDFLIDETDVDVSFRAGADAILLIASMLDFETFKKLYLKAKSLGLEVLVELHSKEECALVSPLRPSLVGINCRDLVSFNLDKLLPLRIKQYIDWPHSLVYESGLFTRSDAEFAVQAGFDGILVGEAVVKVPSRVRELRLGLTSPRHLTQHFWTKMSLAVAPAIKVCGLTREIDARLAADLGATALGFIFADSPRRATSELVRALSDLPQAKVGVVVAQKDRDFVVDPEVIELLESGYLDAVQFSGNEDPSHLENFEFPFYKVVHPQTLGDLEKVKDFSGPRVLLDSKSGTAFGGTGIRLSDEIIRAAKAPLWLAGGLNPDNIGKVIREYRPELVDVASGIEESPGIKSEVKMRAFFKEVQNAEQD